jgi:hypothetical protein
MPPAFVIAFDEDGTVRVFESTAVAEQEFEGVDVESGVVKFYDDTGTYLQPVFSEPNQSGKILGLVSWVQSGKYTLTPNPSADEDSFALALFESSVLESNAWFGSLAELKSALAGRGVQVERGADGKSET